MKPINRWSMRSLGLGLLVSLLFVGQPLLAEAEQPVWRVLEDDKRPADARLGEPRGTRDTFHPWSPPATQAAWEETSEAIRQRVLVSNGLWPMPPSPPLEPTIHGKIDRGDYTVEKVYFASHPGHYVTGNLYRPTNVEGRVPGVLCPHGHWSNGRFYDAEQRGGGERSPERQLEKGAEEHLSGARFPVQARMAQLARMGCVVFHYDMVGYADSQQIDHSAGFIDAEAGLRLQNFMGLQTFNSIRGLDFLLSLPDVDPDRIGVTGSSGGGTQTFMLCAVDPRPDVAFPAVMVSTNMQGGCVCENAQYLRQGINNVAITALFAPKPLAMSGADDWTIDIETKGLPELKQVYAFYDKAPLVEAKAFPQFGHNYNQVAREMMYSWFNEHLQLGLDEPIKEQDFEPIEPAQLSVFDDEHPRPDDAKSSDQLRKYLTQTSQEQYAEMLPNNADEVGEYQALVGAAARVMFDTDFPQLDEIDVTTEEGSAPLDGGITLIKGFTGRKDADEQIPWVGLFPSNFGGTAVLWIDGQGKQHLFDADGQPTSAVKNLLEAGKAVFSADVFLTGEFLTDGSRPDKQQVDENFDGYTYGYNRPLLSNRVRDTLTALAGLVRNASFSEVQLAGTGEAGPWVLLAAAIAGDDVGNTVVDLGGFDFGDVESTADPMYLPGALRYGGLGGLAALGFPAKLTIAGAEGTGDDLKPLKKVYAAAKSDRLSIQSESLDAEAVVELLD